MKGLVNFPSKKNFIDAYETLQFKKNEVSEDDTALYLQWARLDPRLAEILVTYISENWERLNALKLNHSLLQQPWPSTAGVLFEFAKKAVAPQKKKLFFHWVEMSVCGIQKNSFWSQFFWGQRSLGGPAMFDDAHFSSQEYQKWNYLGRENLFNKNKFPLKYSLEVRFEILKSLSKAKNIVTTKEYWNAIGQSISLRQAERDLKSWPLLCDGKTKGRRFRLRSK